MRPRKEPFTSSVTRSARRLSLVSSRRRQAAAPTPALPTAPSIIIGFLREITTLIIPIPAQYRQVRHLRPPRLPTPPPPAAVTDLALSDASDSAITVSWTAPGDDGNTGTATSYDLRYSTSLITAGNFDSATQVTGEPAPQPAGTSQSKVVSGLSPSTLYYFALKTSDEVPNASAMSNVPSLAHYRYSRHHPARGGYRFSHRNGDFLVHSHFLDRARR